MALSVSFSARFRSDLAEYATARAAAVPASDAYVRSGRVLNLLDQGQSAQAGTARDAELIASGHTLDDLSKDAVLSGLAKERGDSITI